MKWLSEQSDYYAFAQAAGKRHKPPPVEGALRDIILQAFEGTAPCRAIRQLLDPLTSTLQIQLGPTIWPGRRWPGCAADPVTS